MLHPMNATTKQCTKCLQTKLVDQFFIIHTRSGPYLTQYTARCKLCCRAACNKYHSTQEGTRKRKEYSKVWLKNNKVAHHAQVRRRHKQRLIEDPEYKLLMCMRSRIGHACKAQYTHKSCRTNKLIGCTIPELRVHIEKQFKPGMTWLNRKEWHIDHIQPCSSFNLSDISEQYKCFHYSNLQPLWAKDNLSKSDHYK